MRSITQAVNEKYSDDDEATSGSGFILFVRKSSPRKRLPSTLILDHCEIDSVGDEQSLSSTLHEVNELDLAHNQISKWTEINKLIRCLPKLSFLNLSYNLLGSANVNAPQILHSSLKKLVLNRVGIQWNDLVPYLCLAPNLEELHLSFNQIEISDQEKDNETNQVFSKIATLHFDGNRVENRDHLRWISKKFPSLTSLVLCDCPLWTLRWTSSAAREAQGRNMSGSSLGSSSSSTGSLSASICFGDGKTSPCCAPFLDRDCTDPIGKSSIDSVLFPCLRSISLNNSMFDCWEEIDQIRSWPSLAELRMQSCPLFQRMTEHERREMTIARLPNLRRLNGGGDISAKEREEAERNFLRRFHDSEVTPARYRELLDTHGHVAPFATVKLAPPKVANVSVRYGEQSWNEKNLSLYMTMKELKEKFSIELGLPASELRLWHSQHQQPMLMRFPAKRLYSYNVKDGDEILIDEKLG